MLPVRIKRYYEDPIKHYDISLREETFHKDILGNFDINICKILFHVPTREISYPTDPQAEQFLRNHSFFSRINGVKPSRTVLQRASKYVARGFNFLGIYDTALGYAILTILPSNHSLLANVNEQIFVLALQESPLNIIQFSIPNASITGSLQRSISNIDLYHNSNDETSVAALT